MKMQKKDNRNSVQNARKERKKEGITLVRRKFGKT